MINYTERFQYNNEDYEIKFMNDEDKVYAILFQNNLPTNIESIISMEIWKDSISAKNINIKETIIDAIKEELYKAIQENKNILQID